MKKFDFKYHMVNKKLEMKVKLLDTKLIQNVYIERGKNLHRNCYSEDEELTNADNVVYKVD